MDHAEIVAMRGHGWAVGAWTVLVAATMLGLATEQTLQLIRTDFPSGTRATSSATSAAGASSPVTSSRREVLPLVTVPKAIARVPRALVAGMKHHSAPLKHSGRIRNGLNGAQGLLAGLALLGASDPQSH